MYCFLNQVYLRFFSLLFPYYSSFVIWIGGFNLDKKEKKSKNHKPISNKVWRSTRTIKKIFGEDHIDSLMEGKSRTEMSKMQVWVDLLAGRWPDGIHKKLIEIIAAICSDFVILDFVVPLCIKVDSIFKPLADQTIDILSGPNHII